MLIDYFTGRRLIGWCAGKIEHLQWHTSPKPRPQWFWRAYFAVWAAAERTRKWGYRVGRFGPRSAWDARPHRKSGWVY